MSFEYIKNCLTCEFADSNISFDEDWNSIYPDKLKLFCICSGDGHGREVFFDHVCENWGESFSEFMRVEKKVSYDEFYKKKLDLVGR